MKTAPQRPEQHQGQQEIPGAVQQIERDAGDPPGEPGRDPAVHHGIRHRIERSIDSYGVFAPHGGGAFSGKDPTKVDRSGAYMARYIAKNIVAASLASRCKVTLAYAIGKAEPVMVSVDTFGTGTLCADDCLEEAVKLVFGLTPAAIIRQLDLLKPVYVRTAAYGHFGRPGFAWERIDKAKALRDAVE